MIQLADDDWAFIPGPPEIPDAPASSTNLREIAMYPPEVIAQAFLAYPDFSLLQDADPSWWQWRAGWERGASFLFVGDDAIRDRSDRLGRLGNIRML